MPRIVYDNAPGDGPRKIEAGRTIIFQPKGELYEYKKNQVIKEFSDKGDPKKVIRVLGKKLIKTSKKGRSVDVQELTNDEWAVASQGKHNSDKKLKLESEYRETLGVDELEIQIRELQDELKAKKSAEKPKAEKPQE